ncbi:MAG: hypothetical protein Q9167_004249 [Letrouitia subvulpina]
MEDNKRGFSLRQKKSSAKHPPISAPRQISHQSNSTSVGSTNNPARAYGSPEKTYNPNKQRPGRHGGNASDLVKRRYSTRFAQLPDFTKAEAPPIPNANFANQQTKQDYLVAAPARSINVDVTAFKDPSLGIEDYSTSVLSEGSDQQLREYQANLRKLKTRASADLQQNVYQNRTQFIKISKEAEKLKEEMRTLSGLMSELSLSLKNASSNLSLQETRPSMDDSTTRARKQANRSSVANLEAMWNTQLQALWKGVEGSQKFLPAIPGRHIVYEQDHWVELDSATWKPRRSVHIFLLNDHLMIALKRENRLDPTAGTGEEGSQRPNFKLVVDKCWPLQNVDMLDLSSMASGIRNKNEVPNAISIRCGSDSFTYRGIERSPKSEKTNLLLAFRRTADELRKSIRAETENINGKAQESMDYYAKRQQPFSTKTDLLRSPSKSKDHPEILIDVDGKQKDLRWVESQIDEMDIEIALQRFENAVRYVEKLRTLAQGLKGNLTAQEMIMTKVDERADKLGDLVKQRLIDTHSFSNATQINIAWLVRLGFDDQARETYLSARSSIITKRSRQCVFEGDLRDYIFQQSYVYFTLIKNTVKIYQQCFPPLMMSACVTWAKEQLDGFNVVLSRQLSSVEQGSSTWDECMEQARENAKMVDEVGLDFKALVKAGKEKDR